MSGSRVLRFLPLVVLLGVSACATKPSQINNVCAVFAQNDGWINNWRRDVGKASKKYGIPPHVMMATIRMESGFDSKARPRRKSTFFGLIPGSRLSSAYGYSQALDGTWLQYQKETGNYSARRTNFGDAADFVGWYHNKSVRTLGIAPHDTHNLYLAYYHGHAGYARGRWRGNAAIQGYARKTAAMANRFQSQMQSCW
ncbi:transglycosylase SLT domain-containing protein [Aquamicrobium zhengzhouense]|uniref:Glucosaminidase domain-containing protein n=1 Tax=Aquamicrobium zhengzhouense TaxID=2781738 RepID=A0ABS0S8E2_9HYPH|nr:glucosaminidase domain-containing protein [Aquamicrobium zhengzhouense]MBI1619059.1 glucosaminidase domain-containing protein [Aquamicrobium zhengzhouense]